MLNNLFKEMTRIRGVTTRGFLKKCLFIVNSDQNQKIEIYQDISLCKTEDDISNVVDELIDRGSYIQVNCDAFHSGFRIRSFVKKLFKAEMVHFIATDAHDTKDRSPKIRDTVSYLSKHYGDEYCRRILFDNPAAVINNEYIES